MAGDRERLTRYSAVQETPEEFSSHDRRKAASNRWSFGRINSFFWMLVSFLCGTGISIGHHFFYSRFNGLRVDEVSINQTWIIRIGTIFAFVAKTLLVIAVSIAFVQQQWLALSSNRFKIRQIDAMTSVLSNALNFLQSRIWLHFPLLTVLAIVVWLLPIAAIITPATINVITKSDNRLELQENVPQLYFDPNRYANLQTLVRSDYVGPSPAALRTAFGSAMTGRMLGIPQTSPNMTYNLEFLGPALRCDHADANLTGDVLTSYKNYLSGVENRYRYISWVPSGYGRGNLTSATGEDIKYLDTDSTDAAHIYVIPNTTDAGPIVIGGMTTGSSDDHYGYQDLLDCKLYNASYRTSFNLTFPTQAIAIESTEFLNPVNASTDIADWRYAKGSPDVLARHAQRICYQSIMDSFGRLLVGYEWWRDGFVVTEKTSWNMMAIDWTTRDGTQKGLEALFQNITLSMLGTSPLTMNSTVAARNAVPVNILTSVNVYSYKPEDLWLAYGIACVAALLSTILGAYGIWRNGGSGYQNIFSTYVRATRNQELKDVIDSNDDAAEPLPKKLSETSIMLDTRKQSTKNISMHTWR